MLWLSKTKDNFDSAWQGFQSDAVPASVPVDTIEITKTQILDLRCEELLMVDKRIESPSAGIELQFSPIMFEANDAAHLLAASTATRWAG